MSKNLILRSSVLLIILSLLFLQVRNTNAAPSAGDIDIPLSGSPSLRSSPVVMDFDSDGAPEIALIGEDGILYLISGTTNQILWQKNVAEYTGRFSRVSVEAGLAAADLDNDGQIELVIATGGLPVTAAKPGALIVLTYFGGNDRFALKAGWPQFPFDELGNTNPPNTPDGTPDGFIATPALGDIDGDGKKEIVIGGMDRRIHAWHHDGSYVNGWPIDRDNKHYRDTLSSAALADLDRDGVDEIIVGTNNYKLPACPNPYYFYVLRGNTTFFPGWPVETTQNIASSPAVGDLDGDGYLDIVAGTGTYNEHCGQPADGKKVYAWDRFGNPLPGWPKATVGNMEASPALGDLDGDGKLDVVIACNDQLDRSCNTIYAWHGNGQPLAGWPQRSAHPDYPSAFEIWDSPRLGDVDGDGKVEVLIGDGLDISEWEANGTLVQPVRRTTRLYHPSGLTIAEVDADGLLETLIVGQNEATGKGILHIWQETGLADGNVPWPTFHRDMQRNGAVLKLFSISGRVMDRNGNGLAGITITNGDKSTQTDSSGAYQLRDLPPGKYRLTVAQSTSKFEPQTLIVQLPPSATDQNFVRVPEKLMGTVLQSNLLGLAGITISLDNNFQSVTDANGSFLFDNLEQKRYVVSPTSTKWRFLPSQKTISLPSAQSIAFYALAQPVSTQMSGSGTYSLQYSDTQNLFTKLTAELRSGNGTLHMIPTLPEIMDIDAFAGHAFEVEIVEAAQAADETQLTVNLNVSITYSNDDLRIVTDETKLTLKQWTGKSWQAVTEACNQGNQTILAAENKLTATLCGAGTYALFGPTERILLPLVQR